MRVTQGAFSFLPDLDDKQIAAQVEYCLRQEWAVSVEFTDDPHPRNTYWEMWGMPMFDLHDAAGVMQEINACRKAHPETYVRVNGFDSTQGWEDGAAVVPGAAAVARAGLPAGTHRSRRPHHPLRRARLCARPAGRPALRRGKGRMR